MKKINKYILLLCVLVAFAAHASTGAVINKIEPQKRAPIAKPV